MTDLAHAESLLKTAVGDSSARFRGGQWEAIDVLSNRNSRVMLVQRTGWGKSSVYFITTRILRDRGAGPTLIVSPLLALMRNQLRQARRLGLSAETINSTNQSDWQRITRLMDSDGADVLLISPERLANQSFVETMLLQIADRIGMLVVDEAHCISDWGHDFRPDYRRIVNILRRMPSNMPVLATTATANDRVINDAREQLGRLEIQRGPLRRESLRLQNLRMPDIASRLAWLARQIPELPGTGIVYVLTKRDAERTAEWLREQKIDAHAYHSNSKDRPRLEELLQDNKIKVLVATTALGMGYDKPDISFVIHYQAPGSIISYYQQVGRAGRAVNRAYGVLIAGKEDADIMEYFRHSAFPTEEHVKHILSLLASTDGMSLREMERELNLRRGQIEKTLKFLSVENPAPVIKYGTKWKRTPVGYEMNRELIGRLTQKREIEWEEVQLYIDSRNCLMSYLCSTLDDPDTENCGRCAACRGKPLLDPHVPQELLTEARNYLRRTGEAVFKPKSGAPENAFPEYGFDVRILSKFAASEGRILCRWGDGGLAEAVASGKKEGFFTDGLVEAAVRTIRKRWRPSPKPEWVACVPSHDRPDLVPDFAERLARRLGIRFIKNAVRKRRENEPQKEQQNALHQCRNLDGIFEVSGNIPQTPVLLVDDIVDSGWTMTVIAVILRQGGSGPVYPLVLASAGSA